jgi:dihydrofolate synthase/folylpolyglutamate synthase
VSEDAFDWLLSLGQFGIKFGLDNMRALMAELGHPERAFRAIHVAGTNGKGSVTAIVEAALRASRRRTGRYTSPHLLDLSERIAIDGTPVSSPVLRDSVEDLRRAVERLQARGTLDVHPTFFEVTTAVAFSLFRAHDVEAAACEVGLGGRLDATNVLSPVACAITSIGFDHQQYLGNTLKEIAAEKAGIIKPGTPVVVGPVGSEAADVIAESAERVGAPIVWALAGVEWSTPQSSADGGQRFSLRTPRHDYGEVRLALAGTHQVENAIVAVRLLEELGGMALPVGPREIVTALDTVRWPGRLETIGGADGRSALLDAAHNAAGALALARHLSTLGPSLPLVFAAMRDKDVEAMVGALAPHVSEVVATRASNPRSMSPEDLADVIRRVAPATRVCVAPDPQAALALAWQQSPHIVVAGSIFLLADIMKVLGRS